MTMTPERARELTGHTPGPLTVSTVGLTNDGQRQVTSDDGRVALFDLQCNVPKGRRWNSDCAQRDANARLYAAASELRDAYLAMAEENERLRKELLCVMGYVTDAASGWLCYRGKSNISEIAAGDLARISAVLKEPKP